MTTMADIREAVRQWTEQHRREHGDGTLPPSVYIGALDQATGGYWSVTYHEDKPWGDASVLPAVAIMAVATLGLAPLLTPLLFTAEHRTIATLTIPTEAAVVVRTGPNSKRRALAEAVRSIVEPAL